MASTSFARALLSSELTCVKAMAVARLPVDQAPQPGLALDDAVGDPHLAAQGGQEDHELEDSVSASVI